jgi:mevalonate kinase
VRAYYDKSGFAREIVDDMESIALEGEEALRGGDLERLGRLMTRNHKMLSILGVSTDQLNKLVDASLPYSYGAKLTGAGGGGSMLALTDRPEKVCEAISRRGGKPYRVVTGVPGLQEETQV